MEKELIKGLFEAHSIQSTGGKSIVVDGITYAPKKVKTLITVELAKKVLNTEQLLEFYEWKDGDIGEHMSNLIRKVLTKRKLREAGLTEDREGDLQKKYSYKHQRLTPIRDILNGNKTLFDEEKGQVTELDYDTWYDSLPPDTEIRQQIMLGEIKGVIKYDPYSSERAKLIPYNGQEIYQFNSHIFPDWRFHQIERPKPATFFFDLMEHLFPKEEARRFVYHWLFNMVINRNQTVLLLSSNMGTGKGTLCDIMEHLVGSPNYQKQSEGFFRSQFNAELINKRVVVFDEVNLSRKYKESFKLYCNNTIPIERKGKDVQTAVENHASFVITNNNKNENFLLADDRRFSVPEITDTPLLDVFKEKDIDVFHHSLTHDPTVIQNIGWWLIKNGEWPEFQLHKPWKQYRFFELVKSSLKEWQKFVVDRVKSRELDEYPLVDLKLEYEENTGLRQFPGAGTMENSYPSTGKWMGI